MSLKRMNPIALQLSEDFTATDAPQIKSLQCLKTGTFYDPRYKKFSITEKMLDEMISNFKKGVRGLVPNLDWRHEGDGPSAGWLKNLFKKKENDEIQLWGDFELTPSGQKSLANKEYGYTSADFDENYTCNETGAKHGCVFKGLALTNRPVIKTMSSVIQLSDAKYSDEVSEKISRLISEGKTQEQAVAIALEMEASGKLSEGDKMNEKEIEELKTNLAMKEKALADMKAELDGFKKSVEEKKLSDQAEIEKIKKENETIKKENDFTKLLSEGKAVPAQKEAFMKGDLIEFAKLSAEVKLSENGHSKGANDESKKDVEDEILEQAKKLSEEKKITMKEAISQVLHSDKKLAEKRAAKFSDEA